jgi:cell division protein FtsI (penicillin-binding protein 3)
LLLLLTAVGGWLFRSGQLPLPGREAERSLLPAAEAELAIPVEEPATPPDEHLPLRGTIYDRNLNELAVSYRLYSLFVQPLKLADRAAVAEQLAQILDADSGEIFQRLQNSDTTVELAKGLDASQSAAVASLRQPGIYCASAEVRYYPGHAAAGQLLGFTNEGVGLSGSEAQYDSALQPGGCRCAELPELDCAGQETVGQDVADVILSLDIELQQQLEELLTGFLRRKEAARGSIAVIELESGQVLAAVRQPGFDPNYFWQADGQREEQPLFAADFLPELIEPLLNEAAAIADAGLAEAALPAAVSAPADNLRGKEWLTNLFSEQNAAGQADKKLTAVQLAAGAASLLNGGKRIAPWLLKAVYDHAHHRFFIRNPAPDGFALRLLAPAEGVNLRRRLLDAHADGDGFLFTSRSSVMAEKNGLSEHRLQELLVAAVPGDTPRLLLMMAVDFGRLEPSPPAAGLPDESLQDFGRKLLPLLAVKQEEPPLQPPHDEKNEANLRRFLLSRQLQQPAEEDQNRHVEAVAPMMPSVIGMSLRNALQRLNPYHMKVQIRGSGRVAAQKPMANASLAKIETCELILKPLFQNEQSAPAPPQPATRTARKIAPRPAGKPDQQNHP